MLFVKCLLCMRLFTCSISFNAENNTARKSQYIPHFTEKETGSERLRKWPKTIQLEPGFQPRQRGPTDHALIRRLLWVDRNQEQEAEERRGIGTGVVLKKRLRWHPLWISQSQDAEFPSTATNRETVEKKQNRNKKDSVPNEESVDGEISVRRCGLCSLSFLSGSLATVK